MALSFKDVAEILKIIDSSECEEVIVEVEDTRIVVRRGGSTLANASAGIQESRETGNPITPRAPKASESGRGSMVSIRCTPAAFANSS